MASSKRWEPTASERNTLLRLGGYQCAICHRNLRRFDKISGKIKYIADAAHMYPQSDDGPRGDPRRRPALVDHVSNLLMLCPNCHRLADWTDVGPRLFPLDKLRAIKREHEAWIAFWNSRPELPAPGPPRPSGLERGQSVSVGGQTYRLPWDERPGRVDSTFIQEWSAERDAVRCQSYAYAETGEARHAWLRRVDVRGRPETGERWRRELVDEATLLHRQLPQLPGLPQILQIETRPDRPLVLVTALPSSVSLLDRYGIATGATSATAGTRGLAEEPARALFAALPTLCAALGALHDAGHAHGALDPGDILIGRSGILVLRDLGRATAEMPARPARQDDVRRLASIVYELVTGTPPLTEADGPPVPAETLNPVVPERASDALSEALSGDIRDARALARRLASARRGR